MKIMQKNRYSITFGYNIKKYRELEKMTQIELAEKLKIAQSTLAKWETGTREPSIEYICKILDTLHVDFEELTTLK